MSWLCAFGFHDTYTIRVIQVGDIFCGRIVKCRRCNDEIQQITDRQAWEKRL